jgi:hypothetical protein
MKNTSSWKTRLGVLGTVAVLAAVFAACEKDGEEPNVADLYPSATANVDYNGTSATSKKAVFFKFSTGKASVVPLDFFDIALDLSMSGPKIFANSGSYGSGVTVYKTTSTNILDDLSAHSDNVKEYTFKTGYTLFSGGQTEVNPFAGAISMGSPPHNVYLIKTEAGDLYKFTFDAMSMSPPSYTVSVVKGLANTSNDAKKVLTDNITGISGPGGYGYIYFDLDAEGGPKALNSPTALKDGVTLDIPKADEWDILFTRTNDQQATAEAPTVLAMVVGRSSVLLNTYKNVKAYTAEGKKMEEVLTIPAETDLISEIDVIGHSWYTASLISGGGANYAVNTNTYIVKTVEGKYAKFQPGSFYGPTNESFSMRFRYYYFDGDGETFDK